MPLTLPEALDRLPDHPENEPLDPEKYGLIELLCTKGDVKKKWDRNNPDEVEDAKRSFDELKAKGYAAFTTDPKTAEKAGPMQEWDPNAEGLIMVPPLRGG